MITAKVSEDPGGTLKLVWSSIFITSSGKKAGLLNLKQQILVLMVSWEWV